MYKHRFLALFTYGMKCLFLFFLLFEAHLTILISSITSWLVTNRHVHGVLLKLLQLCSQIFPHTQLKQANQPCQFHGYNISASLLVSVLLPMSSMAGDASALPLRHIHSTWMPEPTSTSQLLCWAASLGLPGSPLPSALLWVAAG